MKDMQEEGVRVRFGGEVKNDMGLYKVS